MNTITVDGRLTKDGEIKEFGEARVLKLSVADGVGFGEREKTNFYSLDVRGKLADLLVEKAVKGAPVFFSGVLTTSEYNGKTYLNIDTKSVIIKKHQGASGGSRPAPRAAPQTSETEDDMPF